MSKKTMPTRLDRTNIKKFLDAFDTVLTDCDGVLWSGSNVIGQANAALNKFRQLGKKVFYVTNNSTKSRDEYMDKCAKLGFIAKKEEIVSSSYIMAEYLKQMNFDKKVFIVGSSGMAKELDAAGIKHLGIKEEPLIDTNPFNLANTMVLEEGVGAVAVGFDGHISYPKLMRAASHLQDPSCIFIATNTDERFPVDGTKHLIFPGTGVMVRAVQTVAEREPIIMGKPSDKMFTVIANAHGIDPARTLMIGDRCNTDILFGKECGLHTLVVLSGVHSLEDMEPWASSEDPEKHKLIADYFLPQLSDLLALVD